MITTINLLLSIVNDILDLKLIEENKFVPRVELFSPRDTFNFITNMFRPQVANQNSTIKFEAVASLNPGSTAAARLISIKNSK